LPAVNSHHVHFFATKFDLETLLRAIESKRELQYVRAGLFDVSALNHQPSLLNDSNFGNCTEGDSVQEVRYLVADRNVPFEIRPVPQHNGGTKYAIDQKANPKTIVFRPGGVFNNTAVIAGDAGTISDDAASLALFQLFSKDIKRQFQKIKSDYMGNEAVTLFDKGWRLTSSVKSPPLYDLTRG